MTENENEELKDIVMEGFPVLEHTGCMGTRSTSCVRLGPACSTR